MRAIQCNLLRVLTSCFSEIEGFFNLIFSHFIALLPLDAPETQDRIVALLKTIATADHQAFIKYRMYVHPYMSFNSPNTVQTLQLVQRTTPPIETSINRVQDPPPAC